MDFAFAPGVTRWDRRAQKVFTIRVNTKLIQDRSLLTVASFLDHLQTTAGLSLPADDLYIASHGNDRAMMVIPLDSTQIHPRTTDPTTYEVAAAAVTSGIVRIANNVNHDSSGTLNSMSVNIWGCRIGAAGPFVDKLKEAFGSESPVTAPKYFHDLYQVGSTGFLEFLKYSFGVVSKKPLADKAAVAAALDGQQFKFRDGSDVATDLWPGWVPRDVSPTTDDRLVKNVYLGLVHPLAKLSKIPDKITFRHEQPKFTYPVGNLSGPPAEPDQIPVLRQALHDDANTPGSPYADTHPLPIYQRFGHSSIDDFVDNLNWKFPWDKKNALMICIGTQHEYTVLVPITDPTDLDNGQLFYNFYPSPGSSDAAFNALLASDDTMFYTA